MSSADLADTPVSDATHDDDDSASFVSVQSQVEWRVDVMWSKS